MEAGQSALHVAARIGNPEIVRCLVLSGADIDLVNKVIAINYVDVDGACHRPKRYRFS